jgi:hypothetical protein
MGYTTESELLTIKMVFEHIVIEREVQLLKLYSNKIRVNLFDPIPPERKLLFLTEELGEVAKAVRGLYIQKPGDDKYISDKNQLYNELIQLAAHTVVWAGSLGMDRLTYEV